MKIIEGGVCAAKGFKAGSVRCGVKESRTNDDTAIIFSECECTAAATYTMNRVKAAPLYVTMEHLEDGVARAIVANAGNANACAPDGMENARRMAKAAAQLLGVAETDVAVASTGVIGQRLNIECIEEHLPELKLEDNASEKANRAIMTTDTKPKTAAVEFTIGGKTCRIGGICKGSGMIHPNMATMLTFITTDVAVAPDVLKRAVKKAADKSFNMVVVYGDTSTNDSMIVLANGLAENEIILSEEHPDYPAFFEALVACATDLAKMIAHDGEGATKFLEVNVTGAATWEDAKTAAMAIAKSPLVKTAFFGEDPNWGRIVCAAGYSGAAMEADKVNLSIGGIRLVENGMNCNVPAEKLAPTMAEHDISMSIDLGAGEESATVWTCDFSYEYVKINGEYHT